MKKTTLLSGTISLPQNLLKKLLLSCFAMLVMLSSYSANITSTGSGNWNSTTPGAPWPGGTVPAATDNVIIANGSSITLTAAITQTGTITVNAGGTLTLGSTLTSNGSSITINGTLVCGTNIINGSSNFTLASALTAFIQSANPNGITSSGTASGSIQNTSATRSFGAIASYTYNGTTNQVTGNGLPLVIQNLTINNTGGANNNIVTLTNNNTVITGGNSAPAGTGGTLTLTAGILDIGTGNTLGFFSNSGSNSITNNGGNIATSGTNGSDGGTVYVLEASGQNLNINGPNTTTFYNLRFGNAPGNGNRHVVQTVLGNVLINDSLIIYTQQFQWQTNAPIYGPNATLYINTNGNQFNLTPNGSATQQEWLPLSSGTIGITPGYPNNVTISHIGTSQGGYNNGNGWVSTTNWAMNGIFTLGDASGNAQVDFSGVPSFTCGGFVLNNGSRFTAPTGTMTVNGSWTDNQAVSGTTQGFFIKGTSTINFGGSGTCGAANTIQAPGAGIETFYNVGIINGTYTKLNSPITITNNLVLTSGILGTSNPTNILSVTNSAPTAISGGGAGTYIDGPVKWNLQAAAGVYNFPVGSNGVGCANDYLPFKLTKVASSASIATVQALTPGSGGIVDATLGALSTTEYWSFATSVALSSGSTISVSRPTPITPLNAIGQSTTGATGTYTSIGGTAVANGVNSSNPISTNTSLFFTLGAPPIVSTLAATSITTTSVTLNGAFNTGSSKTTSFNFGPFPGAYTIDSVSIHSPINSTTSVLDSAFVTGLVANTEYHYQATDGTDNGSDVTFITAPNPPTVGSASNITTTSFTANWTAPAVTGTAPYTYTLEYSTSSTFATFTSVTGITGTSLAIAGLSPVTTYYYRVETVNASGPSTWSSTSPGVTTDVIASVGCAVGSGGQNGDIVSTTVLPVIDGQVDPVWDNIAANNITNLTVGGSNNNTQTWKALWTADTLYFLAQVTDASLISLPTSLGGVAVPGATMSSNTSDYYDE
ncbi:MAG TPA: sugar-binding protein, partial [Bacteroidia bacterium]|nr:sugar-binding protein [Bacteroidia bacterium]